MSEYIKREDALKAIEVCVNESIMPEEWRSGMLDAYDEVKSNVPSADVVGVRHGHWILRQPNSLHLDRRDSLFECSVCGANRIRRTGEILNYCPNCGAKMI